MNGFHMHNLKRRFEANNPGVGCDAVDWTAIGKESEYEESLEALRDEYPQFMWGEKEDFDSYSRDFLKGEALKMGLTVTVRADAQPKRDTPPNEFYEAVAQDIRQSLILLLSERGHGKSTALKTIVAYIKQRHPDIEFKVFDPSLSWYKAAPLRYRQLVTAQALHEGRILNLPDTVYELGSLSEPERRAFVSNIIGLDYKLRYMSELKGITGLPLTVYIVEEANTVFNSYSFRRGDSHSTILSDFVSVGRNFGLSAILVSTAEIGELSPSIRRRRRVIYGRIVSPQDTAEAKRHSRQLGEQVKTQPRYTFTYAGARTVTAKIPDTVNTQPTDYNPPAPQTQQKRQENDKPLTWREKHKYAAYGATIATTCILGAFLILVYLVTYI